MLHRKSSSRNHRISASSWSACRGSSSDDDQRSFAACASSTAAKAALAPIRRPREASAEDGSNSRPAVAELRSFSCGTVILGAADYGGRELWHRRLCAGAQRKTRRQAARHSESWSLESIAWIRSELPCRTQRKPRIPGIPSAISAGRQRPAG